MRAVIGTMLAIVVLAAYTGLVRADDATKEVTLKGTMQCAKCTRHETKECQNVLSVKEGDTETLYYFVANDLSKENHGKVCHGPKDGVSVTGTVEEKDGKKWITVSKIEFPA